MNKLTCFYIKTVTSSPVLIAATTKKWHSNEGRNLSGTHHFCSEEYNITQDFPHHPNLHRDPVQKINKGSKDQAALNFLRLKWSTATCSTLWYLVKRKTLCFMKNSVALNWLCIILCIWFTQHTSWTLYESIAFHLTYIFVLPHYTFQLNFSHVLHKLPLSRKTASSLAYCTNNTVYGKLLRNYLNVAKRKKKKKPEKALNSWN